MARALVVAAVCACVLMLAACGTDTSDLEKGVSALERTPGSGSGTVLARQLVADNGDVIAAGVFSDRFLERCDERNDCVLANWHTRLSIAFGSIVREF